MDVTLYSGTICQQMMTSGNVVTKTMSSTGLNPIPYDRNLYLTVTSPDGQDKEILGSKEQCQKGLSS